MKYQKAKTDVYLVEDKMNNIRPEIIAAVRQIGKSWSTYNRIKYIEKKYGDLTILEEVKNKQ